MKKKFLLLTVSAIFSILFAIPSQAEDMKGKFTVGLNYPGLGVRYFLNNKLCFELKGQSADNVSVIGIRSYYYFKPKLPFVGLELDSVSFKGEESEGTGTALELFIGGEHFFAKKMSVGFDIGPALISLADKNYSVSVSGIEFVANFGINWYLGK